MALKWQPWFCDFKLWLWAIHGDGATVLDSSSRLVWEGLRNLRGRNGAAFPEVAIHVDAEHFDFFGVAMEEASICSGAGIAEETHADGDGIALLLVAVEDDDYTVLAQAFIGDFGFEYCFALVLARAAATAAHLTNSSGAIWTGFGFIPEIPKSGMRGSSGGGRSEVSIIRFINLEGVLLVIF